MFSRAPMLLLLVVLVAAAFLAPSSPVVAAPHHPLFAAILTGEAEVPGPGDRNGQGVALISFPPHPGQAQGTVCFVIVVEKIALPITAAHIHRGAAGEAGPIVVGLFEGSHEEGVLRGCVQAEQEVLSAIQQDRSNYYVNVHNEPFPDGAVRGQLF